MPPAGPALHRICKLSLSLSAIVMLCPCGSVSMCLCVVILMFYACGNCALTVAVAATAVTGCHSQPFADLCYTADRLPLLQCRMSGVLCPLARLPLQMHANLNSDFWPFNWHTIFHSLPGPEKQPTVLDSGFPRLCGTSASRIVLLVHFLPELKQFVYPKSN